MMLLLQNDVSESRELEGVMYNNYPRVHYTLGPVSDDHLVIFPREVRPGKPGNMFNFGAEAQNIH